MMRANGAAARQTRVKMAELRAWAVVLSSSGGKTFYGVKTWIAQHLSFLTWCFICFHLLIHCSPRYQDIEISRFRKTLPWNDNSHCSCASVNFTLFTIHIRLVGNMKRGGSKWASGSRTVEVVAVEAAVEPEATTAWQELRCPRASNSSRLTLCRPVLCFLCFVCVC